MHSAGIMSEVAWGASKEGKTQTKIKCHLKTQMMSLSGELNDGNTKRWCPKEKNIPTHRMKNVYVIWRYCSVLGGILHTSWSF